MDNKYIFYFPKEKSFKTNQLHFILLILIISLSTFLMKSHRYRENIREDKPFPEFINLKKKDNVHVFGQLIAKNIIFTKINSIKLLKLLTDGKYFMNMM